jgi:hypothetical protein
VGLGYAYLFHLPPLNHPCRHVRHALVDNLTQRVHDPLGLLTRHSLALEPNDESMGVKVPVGCERCRMEQSALRE